MKSSSQLCRKMQLVVSYVFTDNINSLNFFSITEEQEQLETCGFLELLPQNSLRQEAIFKLSTDAILPPYIPSSTDAYDPGQWCAPMTGLHINVWQTGLTLLTTE